MYTGTTQNTINFLDIVFQEFKERSHYCMMDSTYMGDLMGLVGRTIWLMNLLKTCQANRVGASITQTRKDTEQGTYKSVCSSIQQGIALCGVALWNNNNIITTLLTYHSPTIFEEGTSMLPKKKDADRKQERVQSEVQ
jgi:hypothetical protein